MPLGNRGVAALRLCKELEQLHGLEQIAARADAPIKKSLLGALCPQPEGVQQVGGQQNFQIGSPGLGAKPDTQRRLPSVQHDLCLRFLGLHAHHQVAVQKRVDLFGATHHFGKELLHDRVELFGRTVDGHCVFDLPLSQLA